MEERKKYRKKEIQKENTNGTERKREHTNQKEKKERNESIQVEVKSAEVRAR